MGTQSRVLVTGGAGFIGSHLVESLVADGFAVRVLDNLSTGRRSNLKPVANRLTLIEGDVRDRETVDAAAQACDLIFHLAAVVSVPQTVDDPVATAAVNSTGTLHVLEAAHRKAVSRVVLASSCAVYGDNPELPLGEEERPRPLSPYALQKLTGEQYARLYYELYGLPTVCLRYFNVYGPRQDPTSPYSGVISIFMQKAVSGEAPVIYGDGGQSRDFVFVADVVRANRLAAAAASAAGRVYNVGTGCSLTINQLWDKIAVMGKVALAPSYGPSRPGDIRNSQADPARAEIELGFKPAYTPEEGLGRTLQWYRQHH
jgi:UDP-glucose 4-epimerase